LRKLQGAKIAARASLAPLSFGPVATQWLGLDIRIINLGRKIISGYFSPLIR